MLTRSPLNIYITINPKLDKKSLNNLLTEKWKNIVIYLTQGNFILVNNNNSLMPHFTGTSKYKYKLKIKLIPCIQSIEKNSYKVFIHLYVLIFYLKVKRYEQNTEYYLYLRRKERIILYWRLTHSHH